MTVNKDDRNEKLIEELYEKLWWYTYDASEEEFDEKEVDAIVRLLDVLEPIKEDTAYEPGAAAAFERFKKRYGLEEEFAEEEESMEKESTEKETEANVDMETDAGMEVDADVDTKVVGEIGTGTKADVASKAVQETGPDTGIKKKRHRKAGKRKTNWKKILIRLGVGAAACVVLMLTLNVGTYALREKSFFEVVREEAGKTWITITGNEDDELGETGKDEETYSSLSEVEEIIGEKILTPSFIPDGYELEEITVRSLDPIKAIVIKYVKEDLYIRIKIDLYPSTYEKAVIQYDESWQFIQKDNSKYQAQYYSKEGIIEAFFTYRTGVYYIFSNEEIEVIEKIVSGLN